jgi:hypothetical protein
MPNNAYNFVGPFWQVYPNGGIQNSPPTLNQVSEADQFLPPYGVTMGDIVPLQVDGSNHPTNLIGTGMTGSTGGSSGSVLAATPFLVVAYGQTSQGIVQFFLMKGSSLQGVNAQNTSPYDYNYYFVPANDLLDYSRLVVAYYNLDVPNNNAVKLYDASMVKNNEDVNDSLLYGGFRGDFKGNNDTFGIWPSTKAGINAINSNVFGSDNGSATWHGATVTINFFELPNPSNTDAVDLNLKSGKFYHPSRINVVSTEGIENGYTDYNEDGYFSGFGMGYPMNFNYAYAPLTSYVSPTILNGYQIVENDRGETWPSPLSVNVYSLQSSNITSYVDFSYNGTPNSYSDFTNLINDFDSSSFINCSCKTNNFCSNSSNNYFTNNCDTIQAGVVQNLTYQFIPTVQLRSNNYNIVSDYTKPGVTGLNPYGNAPINPYTITTLPENIVFSNTGFTGPTGPGQNPIPIGTFPISLDNLIDTNATNTEYTPAQNSLIGAWANFPNNSQFICDREIGSLSYCGFTDYYDSLFGTAYQYGTCGSTGAGQTPFQKGACPPGPTGQAQVCVPNFEFLDPNNPYNSIVNPPFICVPEDVGITTAKMLFYETFVPPFPPGKNSTYPNYNVTQVPATGDTATKVDKLFLYIAIAFAIILLIFIIFIIYKIVSNKSKFIISKK